jgi:hypothetical protein
MNGIPGDYLAGIRETKDAVLAMSEIPTRRKRHERTGKKAG